MGNDINEVQDSKVTLVEGFQHKHTTYKQILLKLIRIKL